MEQIKNLNNLSGYNQMRAPRPVIGKCLETGTWKNTDQIKDCLECVNKLGYNGDTQFYCDGKCMSEFSTNQICSTKSLVAETSSQCYKPCVQTGSPTSIISSGFRNPENFDNNNFYDNEYKYSVEMASTRGFKTFIGV